MKIPNASVTDEHQSRSSWTATCRTIGEKDSRRGQAEGWVHPGPRGRPGANAIAQRVGHSLREESFAFFAGNEVTGGKMGNVNFG